MPDQDINDEAKLRKLGQRVRQGYAKEHPISDRSRETVRSAVREQWEREQAAERQRPNTPPPPSRDREPEEPDQGR